jgi:hypothetical protein
VTKRVAAVAITFGLPLTIWANRGHAPLPETPLDVAYHFCSCSTPGYGYFHRAPIRIAHRPDVTEWT